MSATVKSFEKDGKTYPTIELTPENAKLRKDGSKPFGFTFGMGKARLILENLDAIRKFVEQNENGENKEG